MRQKERDTRASTSTIKATIAGCGVSSRRVSYGRRATRLEACDRVSNRYCSLFEPLPVRFRELWLSAANGPTPRASGSSSSRSHQRLFFPWAVLRVISFREYSLTTARCFRREKVVQERVFDGRVQQVCDRKVQEPVLSAMDYFLLLGQTSNRS